jgi:hypothetical protein
MTFVKRIVLDVLKPHHPNVLEFSKAIAECGPDYRVTVTVAEVDERTESVLVSIQGKNIDLEAVIDAITGIGASVHSIDEVEVSAQPADVSA